MKFLRIILFTEPETEYIYATLPEWYSELEVTSYVSTLAQDWGVKDFDFEYITREEYIQVMNDFGC